MSKPFNVIPLRGMPKDMLVCISVEPRPGESWIDAACRAAEEGRLIVVKNIDPTPPPEPRP